MPYTWMCDEDDEYVYILAKKDCFHRSKIGDVRHLRNH
jgi:hypothetical protein